MESSRRGRNGQDGIRVRVGAGAAPAVLDAPHEADRSAQLGVRRWLEDAWRHGEIIVDNDGLATEPGPTAEPFRDLPPNGRGAPARRHVTNGDARLYIFPARRSLLRAGGRPARAAYPIGAARAYISSRGPTHRRAGPDLVVEVIGERDGMRRCSGAVVRCPALISGWKRRWRHGEVVADREGGLLRTKAAPARRPHGGSTGFFVACCERRGSTCRPARLSLRGRRPPRRAVTVQPLPPGVGRRRDSSARRNQPPAPRGQAKRPVTPCGIVSRADRP